MTENYYDLKPGENIPQRIAGLKAAIMHHRDAIARLEAEIKELGK